MRYLIILLFSFLLLFPSTGVSQDDNPFQHGPFLKTRRALNHCGRALYRFVTSPVGIGTIIPVGFTLAIGGYFYWKASYFGPRRILERSVRNGTFKAARHRTETILDALENGAPDIQRGLIDAFRNGALDENSFQTIELLAELTDRATSQLQKDSWNFSTEYIFLTALQKFHRYSISTEQSFQKLSQAAQALVNRNSTPHPLALPLLYTAATMVENSHQAQDLGEIAKSMLAMGYDLSPMLTRHPFAFSKHARTYHFPFFKGLYSHGMDGDFDDAAYKADPDLYRTLFKQFQIKTFPTPEYLKQRSGQ